MAGFGGAVKLTGEAEYRAALAKINQQLREVGSEMKVVSSQYAKNDTSQEALSAQTEVLNKKLEQQKAKLSALQGQERAMNAQYTASATAHQKLTATLEAERNKLSQIEAAQGKGSAAYQAQAKVVAQLSADVDKSTAAMNSNEIAMSKMRTQVNAAQADINKTDAEIRKLSPDMSEAGDNAESLGKNVQDSGEKAEKAGDGFTVFKGVVANLATSAIQSAVAGVQKLGSALVDIGKQSVEAYSTFEQASGGIQTLFGTGGDTLEEYAQRVGLSVDQAKAKYDELDAANATVMQNAWNAWQTAGMSANDYMETVTGFSASLVQSLGGDTKKAADYANRAVVDMSDNANKMGTSMQDIQNAYQGFAKQNYTMLDNLKLGYGGTQAEMQRLIKDASQMTDVQNELGVTVDASSMSFGNIVNAISVMQTHLNIAGTTAKEASTTVEGSVNGMKAAWANLLTNMSIGDGLGDSMNQFVDSVKTVVSNVLPVVEEAITGIGDLAYGFVTDVLPDILADIPDMVSGLSSTLMDTVNALVTAVFTALPSMMDTLGQIVPDIAQMIIQNLPMLVTVALQLVESLAEGIAQALPTLIGMLPTLITQTITALIEQMPLILQAGMDLLIGLVNGIVAALPQLVAMLPTIITSMVTGLVSNISMLVDTGLQLLTALINGLITCIPQLVAMLPTIIDTMVTTLLDNLPLIIEGGFQLLIGLINGLISAIPQLVAMLPQIITTIVTVLVKNLPKILKMGGVILKELIKGIGNVMGDLGSKMGDVGKTILDKIKEVPDKMGDIGRNIIEGLWKGLEKAKDWLKDKIASVANWIPGWIKDKLGIHSPSRVMRDQVGVFIAEGIGVGFEDEMSRVKAQMLDAMPSPDAFAQSYDFGDISGADSSGYRAGGYMSQTNIVDAITEALKGVKVVLDDEVAGRFVTKTVTAAIYR